MTQAVINLEAGYSLAAVDAALPAGSVRVANQLGFVVVEDKQKAASSFEADLVSALDTAALAYNSIQCF